MPFFSIIIPLYNKEKFIVKTVQSALNQTYTDFEIIIINDGSTDGSLEVLNQLTDSRIKIFTIKNQGVSFARNYGITKASAEYIAFLDADDLWLPKHLESIKKLITDFPQCGLYANGYVKKNNKIIIESHYKNIPKNWKGVVEDYFESSIATCIAWTSAVVVPKHVLNNLGGFDEKITLGAGEDTDLWIRIALQYKVAFNSKTTAIYNLHAENRISNSNTNLRRFIDLDIYEDTAKDNLSLKRYLDLHRYAIALQYKLVNNAKKADFYVSKLDKASLNKKQYFIIIIPSSILWLIIGLKEFLSKQGIQLRGF